MKTLPLNSGLGNFSVTLLVSGGQFPMVLECKFKLVPYIISAMNIVNCFVFK